MESCSQRVFERDWMGSRVGDRKNILVTGGAGFMGSDFIRYLLCDLSFEGKIINLDLLTYAANLDNLASVSKNPHYTFVKGDICDLRLVEKVLNEHEIDTIVHFAAESHVDRSIDEPKTFIDTNILGTYTLLEAVRAHPGVYMHFISTDEVYGDLPSSEGIFTEESNYNPSSPYAASKAAADHLVMSYRRTFGLNLTISHAANNYGQCQHEEKLIPKMVSRCLNGDALTIYGSGENIRDWLYVRDHTQAVYTIINGGKTGEVYNIGGENEQTNLSVIDQIIDTVANICGNDPLSYRSQIAYVEDRPGHDFRYAMDISKIKSELGWQPQMNFQEGLKKSIEGMIDG